MRLIFSYGICATFLCIASCGPNSSNLEVKETDATNSETAPTNLDFSVNVSDLTDASRGADIASGPQLCATPSGDGCISTTSNRLTFAMFARFKAAQLLKENPNSTVTEELIIQHNGWAGYENERLGANIRYKFESPS